jgi:ribosomal protein S18 acetylase RimI-like enzyme
VDENLIVRRAVVGDAEGIACVHTRAWQSAYRRIFSDGFLDALRWESRFEMWSKWLSDTQPNSNNLFVATNADGTVTGFALIGDVRDDDLASQKFLELYLIYAVPEVWDLGVGRALMDVALASAPSGTPGVSLWTLADNERGRRFYKRQGFKHDGTRRLSQVRLPSLL